MAVTASFGGQTYQFPDGTTDEQIYEALNKGTGQYGTTDMKGYGQDSLLTQQEQDSSWGFYKDGQNGSILDAAGAGWDAMVEGIAAANVGGDRSEVARQRLGRKVARAQEEESKLGLAGNVASGALRYAPAIAAGIVNPVLGGVAAGGMSSGDAVRAQYEEGQELDYDKAGLAGIATGATDMALGGLGRLVPKPGVGAGLGAKAMAQGKQILAEDVPSAMTSQMYENWAADRDLTQNVGTAALVGGAAGAGVRGSLAGMSKAMNIPFNKGGEKALADTVDIEMGAGPNPNQQFTSDYAEHANVIGGLRDKIRNSSDEAEIADNLSVLNKETESNAHLDATARFAKALNKEDAHIIDSMYDVDIDTGNGKWNIGENGLNVSKDDMIKSREELVKSKGSIFQSKRKQLDKGLTATAFNEKSQVDGRKIRSKAQGYFDENLTNLKKEAANSSARGDSPEIQSQWKKAEESYQAWMHALTARNKESDSIDTIHTARVMARDFNDAVTRLGFDNKIKDMNGEVGNLNILADYQGFAALTDGFRKQNKQFSQGKPDTLKESVMSYMPATVGMGAMYMGHPALAAAAGGKQLVDEALRLGRRHKAGKNIKAAKERAASLVPSAEVEAKIRGGDGPGAAEAARVDLESQGIKTAEPAPVQQAPVEAPVTPPESVASARKVDAKVRPAPAPKAVQEPVVEAPAPAAPKVEAKAPKAPEKSKAAIRKEKEAARKAEANARREAKQAAIAAKMQEEIQAGAKRGEPLGRTAPSKKVEETVEAPVETPAVVEPKAKPEAKAKAKPAQKAKEEPTVEEPAPVTTEPAVETPAPKVDAKGRTKPEPKKVEEPAVEAPVSTPKQPLGKAAPGRKAKAEEPVESVTEAPVKEAEVEAPKVEEAPKIPAAKLVREPLKKVAEEKWSVGRRQADPEGFRKHMQAKDDLKKVDQMMQTHDKYTPEEIAQAIEDTGGARAFMEKAREVGKTPDTYLGLRMRELERLRQAEVKTKTSEMKAILKGQDVTVPSKPTEADVKAERVAADRKDFDDEMKALAIHPDDVAQVSKSIEGGMSLKNARKEAARLNNERKAQMKKDIAAEEKALKEATALTDKVGKKAQVDEYVSGLKVEGDNHIQAMVDDVFKHNTSTVTPKEVQNLLNKIDKYLTKQKEEYNNLARAGGKADPRHPEWQAMAASYRSAQNVLKSNRRKLDRMYSNADESAQEAAQALRKREADYDKLFKEANQRDANIVQVRNQKDELNAKLQGLGFAEKDVRRYVADTFFERDSVPLTELGKKHIIEKFIDQQGKARTDAIQKKQKAVKSAIADTENGTLMEMTRSLTDDVEFDGSLNGADDLLAMTRALAEETKSRGMTKESERLESFNTGLLEGKVNRLKFPDNPELWVPYEVKKKIQDSFGEGSGSAYAGNLWMNIKAAVTGSTKDDGKFGTLTRKELESKISKLEGKVGGKLLTGDDDIIIK